VIAPFLSARADDAGIPVLQVGTDRDLAEPSGSVIRLRGTDTDGGELFDHHALTLSGREASALAEELDTPGSSAMDADERAQLIERLYRLAAHTSGR